uniref:Protein kinase domain-containing protein n=1 Tax=Capra hircus TaxID=9925 RepID=A0A452EYZ4_CAPHI
ISPRVLSHSPWAVKKINPRCNDVYQSMYLKRLAHEAKNLKRRNHPNIIAFTEAGEGEKFLNDLIEEQNKDSQDPSPAAIILKVALNMVRGLKHLHQDKKLLRGDIKSSNIVIKGDFETIKICDVGVSLPLDESMTVTPGRPKEALEEDGITTNKADVFAFGLTQWAMMTLSIPHISFPDDDDDETFDETLGMRPPITMEELGETYQRGTELFSVRTDEDPKGRPAAAHTVEASELDVLWSPHTHDYWSLRYGSCTQRFCLPQYTHAPIMMIHYY